MNEDNDGRRDPADSIHDDLGPAPAPEVVVPIVKVNLNVIVQLFKKIFEVLR